MYLSEDLQQNKLIVKNNFITILAAIIVDLDVSATAVRIYCYLAYKANCWQFCNRDIKVALGIKSDHSISKYFKELIDGGYLSREEIKNNGRFAGYQYYLTTVCQKMTNGKNEITDDESRMLKNDNRQLKEEKEKSTKKEKEELFNNNININNNNQKEKNNKKEKTKTDEKKNNKVVFVAKNEIDLEFVRFLDYRRKIKKPYKNQESLDMKYKEFVKMCYGSATIAKQIVDNTIKNQWQGLFELKGSGKGRFTVNSNNNAYDVGVKA
jgi:hypothetical protein